MALSRVRGEIQKRAGFDIEELRPIQRAPLARAPVLFVVARDDDFVRPHHTEKLYEASVVHGTGCAVPCNKIGRCPCWGKSKNGSQVGGSFAGTLG